MLLTHRHWPFARPCIVWQLSRGLKTMLTPCNPSHHNSLSQGMTTARWWAIWRSTLHTCSQMTSWADERKLNYAVAQVQHWPRFIIPELEFTSIEPVQCSGCCRMAETQTSLLVESGPPIFITFILSGWAPIRDVLTKSEAIHISPATRVINLTWSHDPLWIWRPSLGQTNNPLWNVSACWSVTQVAGDMWIGPVLRMGWCGGAIVDKFGVARSFIRSAG